MLLIVPEKHLSIMSAKKKIIDLNINSLEYTDFYLFGSSVYSDVYNDIDIAIIYDKSKIDVQKVIEFRKKVINEISKKLACSCDIILLSKEEEVEMNFLLNAKTEKIKKTTHSV